MVNSTTNTNIDITMKGEMLEEVASFKYLGATLSKDGNSNAEVQMNIAMATDVMSRLSWGFFNKQFHQLPNQVQALQVSLNNTTLMLRDLKASS
ncbi:hypothetical protein DPMN_001200 [Dreissena polymorpha]|uniref:Uncharacterized protein n=1 Tax=Dreissena polymorpha TaxID=45954 RepID=A0A9D4RSV2_DREPO|nr:hypothetical protein DPMN_001200 [Dreissena polymorpha]